MSANLWVKKVEVAVGVDDQLENIFVAIYKPIKYGNYYSFSERIANQIIEMMKENKSE
jgi:hypothetical protein